MKKTTAMLMTLVVAAAASPNGHRLGRASTGSFAGASAGSNGGFAGGSNVHTFTSGNLPNMDPNGGAYAGSAAFAGGNGGGVFAGPGGVFHTQGPAFPAFPPGFPFAGYPGAFSGAYAGPHGAHAFPGIYAPMFPFPDQDNFQKFFEDYFKTLAKNLNTEAKRSEFVYEADPKPDAPESEKDSSPGEDEGAFKKNAENQKAAFNAAQNAFHATAGTPFGPGFPFNGGAGFVGAAAGASAGPHGGQQYAGVYPANPSKPNIHTKFSSDPNLAGTFGVASSSFSSSSNVDGKKTSFKQATTTVNDNGKIKTYTITD